MKTIKIYLLAALAIYRKMNWRTRAWISAILFLLVIGVVMHFLPESEPSKEVADTEKADITAPPAKPIVTDKPMDSAALKRAGKTLDSAMIADFIYGLDTVSAKASKDYNDINTEITYFNLAARFALSKKGFKEFENGYKKVSQKLVSAQKREFPLLRKRYAFIVADKGWEFDVSINIGGNKNSTIEFISGDFAAHKNIMDFHSSMVDQLTNLRFKRVNYKWIPHADDFTYYEIDSPEDGALIE